MILAHHELHSKILRVSPLYSYSTRKVVLRAYQVPRLSCMMVVFNIDDFHSGKSIDRLIENFGWTFLEHLQNLSMHINKTPKTLSYQALYFTTMKLRLRIKKDFSLSYINDLNLHEIKTQDTFSLTISFQ